VLEIGCGNGAFARTLIGLGHTVTAFDASPSGVLLARESTPPVEAQVWGVDDELPTAWCGRFDSVVSLEVIEHLYHPRLLVQRARQALQPGGVLILSTPYHGYLKYAALALTGRSAKHFDPLWDGGHIKFFTRASLRELLIEADFRDVRFRFAGRVPWLWKSVVVCARKGPSSDAAAL
jgi:2-polyprenyl-3-methyl-5-hydroxy-6-metoxy-1,4-benzoquinol methylase